MLGTKFLVVTVLTAVALAAACAHAPNALNTDDTVSMMREDYVSTHPEGRYNDYIRQGQVTRGMNFLEVSASWGIPETRSRSRDRRFEYWTFFGKDELSGDWTRYTMVFENGILADWELNRHFTKNGTLTRWQIPADDPAMQQVRRLNNGDTASPR
jgi:hypothetical protein